MKTDTYNKGTVWFLSTPIRNIWHSVQPPKGGFFLFAQVFSFIWQRTMKEINLCLYEDAFCRKSRNFSNRHRIKRITA